jgi:hypothetical protein
MRLVAEQHWRAEYAVARLQADVEIDRPDVALDGAELHAFDLTRDRPELARGIDLHLDAATRRLFERLLVVFL